MCVMKKHRTDSLFGAPCQDNLHQVSTNHCKSGVGRTMESVWCVCVGGGGASYILNDKTVNML